MKTENYIIIGSQNILSIFFLIKGLVVGGIEPPENEQNKQAITQTNTSLITIHEQQTQKRNNNRF